MPDRRSAQQHTIFTDRAHILFTLSSGMPWPDTNVSPASCNSHIGRRTVGRRNSITLTPWPVRCRASPAP
jgi:hypothetical protein